MKSLDVNNEARYTSLKYTLLFIAVSYLFSLAMRMIWVFHFHNTASFFWNHELMINTNDGYYFASAVQYLLSGMHDHNPQIPVALQSYPGVIYTSLLFAKILPVSLETIILYLPAFISSLIVIPIILVSKLFKMPLWGFFSALLGSIGMSYYNRTMTGYYDSDMFAVLFQMFILYAFFSLSIEHKKSSIATVFLFISVYPFFYPQGLSLIYAMYFIYIGYTLYMKRQDPIFFATLAIIAIALSPIAFFLKIILALAIFLALSIDKIKQIHWIGIALIAFIVFLFEANVFSLVYAKISDYTEHGTETVGLHFFQVMQTVREAGAIPFNVMAERISGSTIGLILALAGYLLLLWHHRPFILALPLIGIGVFSLIGGLRFTVYAVPVAALSSVYFFYFLTKTIQNQKIRTLIIATLTTGIIYPNITHIIGYQVPTVFMSEEVKTLDNLKKIGSSNDYVIAWWDYGYPIWFYTNKNTLIDGGKHEHDNFIVSEILLTASQEEAARLARIAVETYVSSDYKEIADTLFYDKNSTAINVSDYLDTLRYQEPFTLPKKTRDIYLYLPWRMIDILPTVSLFSNLDLNTPDSRPQPFFYQTTAFQDTGRTVELGQGISILKETNAIKLGNKEVPIKQFFQVGYDNTNRLQVNHQQFASEGLNIVYMPNYGRFLVLDDSYLNSTYIQMFVFEQYDKKLFEPVELSPLSKIYKLKV